MGKDFGSLFSLWVHSKFFDVSDSCLHSPALASTENLLCFECRDFTQSMGWWDLADLQNLTTSSALNGWEDFADFMRPFAHTEGSSLYAPEPQSSFASMVLNVLGAALRQALRSLEAPEEEEEEDVEGSMTRRRKINTTAVLRRDRRDQTGRSGESMSLNMSPRGTRLCWK